MQTVDHRSMCKCGISKGSNSTFIKATATGCNPVACSIVPAHAMCSRMCSYATSRAGVKSQSWYAHSGYAR